MAVKWLKKDDNFFFSEWIYNIVMHNNVKEMMKSDEYALSVNAPTTSVTTKYYVSLSSGIEYFLISLQSYTYYCVITKRTNKQTNK